DGRLRVPRRAAAPAWRGRHPGGRADGAGAERRRAPSAEPFGGGGAGEGVADPGTTARAHPRTDRSKIAEGTAKAQIAQRKKERRELKELFISLFCLVFASFASLRFLFLDGGACDGSVTAGRR